MPSPIPLQSAPYPLLRLLARSRGRRLRRLSRSRWRDRREVGRRAKKASAGRKPTVVGGTGVRPRGEQGDYRSGGARCRCQVEGWVYGMRRKRGEEERARRALHDDRSSNKGG